MSFSTLVLADIPIKSISKTIENPFYTESLNKPTLLAASFTRKSAVPRRNYSDDNDQYDNYDNSEERVPFSGSQFGSSSSSFDSPSSFRDDRPSEPKTYSRELEHDEWWNSSRKPSLLW